MSEIIVNEAQDTVTVPKEKKWREQAILSAINLAQRFQSDILFCASSLCIDAKSSVMALMMLGALPGQSVEVTARGADSELAVRDLSASFRREKSNFHEAD